MHSSGAGCGGKVALALTEANDVESPKAASAAELVVNVADVADIACASAGNDRTIRAREGGTGRKQEQ